VRICFGKSCSSPSHWDGSFRSDTHLGQNGFQHDKIRSFIEHTAKLLNHIIFEDASEKGYHPDFIFIMKIPYLGVFSVIDQIYNVYENETRFFSSENRMGFLSLIYSYFIIL
jgi:hypothetical protein